MSEKRRTHAQFAQAQHESGDANGFLSPSSLQRDFGARWDLSQRRWVFPDGSVGLFSRFDTVSAETMMKDAQSYRLKLARWEEDNDAGIYNPKPTLAVKVIKTVPAFQAVEVQAMLEATPQEMLAAAETPAAGVPGLVPTIDNQVAGQTEPTPRPPAQPKSRSGGRVTRLDTGDDDPDYK